MIDSSTTDMAEFDAGVRLADILRRGSAVQAVETLDKVRAGGTVLSAAEVDTLITALPEWLANAVLDEDRTDYDNVSALLTRLAEGK